MENIKDFNEFINEDRLNEELNLSEIKDKVKNFFKKHIIDNWNGKNLLKKIEKEFGGLTEEQKREKIEYEIRKFKRKEKGEDIQISSLFTVLIGMEDKFTTMNEYVLLFFFLYFISMCLRIVRNYSIDTNVEKYIDDNELNTEEG